MTTIMVLHVSVVITVFCEHCNPDGYNDTPCVVDYYKCPNCDKKLNIHQKFCDECGTKLDLED